MTPNDELAALIARHSPGNGIHQTVLPRVSLVQSLAPTLPMPTLYEPAVCFVASGRKQVELGCTTYVYDRTNFLVVSVDLPVTGAVVQASADKPFLCMRLNLDVRILSELVFDRPSAGSGEATLPGLMLATSTPELMDAAVRLLLLLSHPTDAPALAPLAEREILYRLLTGPCASMMRHIASANSCLSQISHAIAWLRRHYRDAFTVEQIAAEVGMSPSAFHGHFKAVTTMSPLKFRNALRLQEARRLMVVEALEAAAAGFEVGYQSPSQFSREYARVFGDSPLRDARRLREDGFASTS